MSLDQETFTIFLDTIKKFVDKKLIPREQEVSDTNKIPNDIRDAILREFKNAPTGDRSKLFNYFVEKKLNNLIQSIGDF